MRGAIIKNNVVTNVINLPDDFVGDVWAGETCVISDVAKIGDAYDGTFTTPAEPEPSLEEKRANASLPRQEFYERLVSAGLYTAVMDKVSASSELWQARFHGAVNYNRNDPDLVAGAKELGLTDEQLDNLFGITSA